MKLENKKELAARTLKIGKERIVFVSSRNKEIKEAITKQDMRDLVVDGAILIKEVKGRKKVVGRKNKRRDGKIKKSVNVRKKQYMIITRKLRGYIKNLKTQEKITREEFIEIRKKIRNKLFKSLAHLKEYIGGLRK